MNKTLVIILAILSMVFWGMSFVWSAVALKHLSPTALIFLRLFISSILLLIITAASRKFEKIKKGDLKQFILLSFFVPFMYFLGENFGIKYTSPIISSVIISTIPLFVAIVAWYKLKEKLKKINFVGISVSFIGVLVMIGNHDFSTGSSLKGILSLIVAVVAAILYTVFLKKLSSRYNAIFLITIQNLLGTIFFIPIFLFVDLRTVLHTTFDINLISAILTLAIFCSTLAFILFTISVRELGVAKTDVFTNLIPVFTVVFSIIILKEHLDMQQTVGIILVITGLFLSQIKKPIKSITKY